MTIYKVITKKGVVLTNSVDEEDIKGEIIKPNFYEIVKWYWQMKLFFWYFKMKYLNNRSEQ